MTQTMATRKVNRRLDNSIMDNVKQYVIKNALPVLGAGAVVAGGLGALYMACFTDTYKGFDVEKGKPVSGRVILPEDYTHHDDIKILELADGYRAFVGEDDKMPKKGESGAELADYNYSIDHFVAPNGETVNNPDLANFFANSLNPTCNYKRVVESNKIKLRGNKYNIEACMEKKDDVLKQYGANIADSVICTQSDLVKANFARPGISYDICEK